MECFHCGSSDLRLSHLQFEDLSELCLLRVPLRCRLCYDRFYVSLFRTWRSGILRKAAHKRVHRDGNDGGVRL